MEGGISQQPVEHQAPFSLLLVPLVTSDLPETGWTSHLLQFHI